MEKTIKIAAVADIHVKSSDQGKWTNFFKKAEEAADILLLCGDLTDHGEVEEAEVLRNELVNCKMPVLAVLGNHDYDRGESERILEVLGKCIKILDGESVIVEGVGFAGIKGFAGGFGRSMLSMFGEPMLKQFVQEAVDETLKLETALARLEHEDNAIPKIVLMHYAPIHDTIVGEPEAIWPWLGCSRHSEPLNKMKVTAAFHGHAHMGTLHGQTSSGVDVFNVSKPILEKNGYELPLFIFDVKVPVIEKEEVENKAENKWTQH